MHDPSLQGVDRHGGHERPLERDRIPCACVVDVAGRIVRVETEEGLVVEAAKGEGGAKLVALAIVVEDDIEDRLHAGRVERVGCGADFAPASRRKARIGRTEHDRIVAPGVGEPKRGQMALVDESFGGHDLDRGHAERGQMGNGRGMGEAGEGSRTASGTFVLRRENPRRLSS